MTLPELLLDIMTRTMEADALMAKRQEHEAYLELKKLTEVLIEELTIKGITPRDLFN